MEPGLEGRLGFLPGERVYLHQGNLKPYRYPGLGQQVSRLWEEFIQRKRSSEGWGKRRLAPREDSRCLSDSTKCHRQWGTTEDVGAGRP